MKREPQLWSRLHHVYNAGKRFIMSVSGSRRRVTHNNLRLLGVLASNFYMLSFE